MLCVPTVKLEMLKVAWPEEFTDPVPSVLPPSLKVTVPLRAAAPVEPGGVTLTVAVKVTDWPDAEGLSEEETIVLVLALLTVCVSTTLVLPWKLLSLQ